MGRRRRVTYRPGKAQGVFGIVWGSIFVLIGLFFVIPAAGLFGVLWTGIALVSVIRIACLSFGKNYSGPEIHIEEEEAPVHFTQPEPDSQIHSSAPSPGADVKGRMEQLESLKSAGLITEQEYREKREEILREL